MEDERFLNSDLTFFKYCRGSPTVLYYKSGYLYILHNCYYRDRSHSLMGEAIVLLQFVTNKKHFLLKHFSAA